jgi:hypothetical protein
MPRKQAEYLLLLVNQVCGTNYASLSEVRIDGGSARPMPSRTQQWISATEGDHLIRVWADKARQKQRRRNAAFLASGAMDADSDVM